MPPEILKKGEKGYPSTYDQKIDVWMLGLALTHSWYPSSVKGLAEQNLVARDIDDHKQISSRLAAEKESGLSDLIRRMLSWDPDSRPTAKEALNDSCLRNMNKRLLEIPKSSEGKRLNVS